MVKQALEMYLLDDDKFADVNNPQKKIIQKGDTVLIKPNMVLDKNSSGGGVECLFTQPSVIEPVIEYVIKELAGEGKIIVGDAPIQGCNFEKLIEESGYKTLIENYKKQDVDIALIDFRNVKTYKQDGVLYQQKSEKHENGILVDLADLSAFSSLSEERLNNLRITDYDPRLLQQHHNKNKHEYMVAREVLEADVIINMPKPKTHRKAGITGALKNLVGINTNKEFLPHHTISGNGISGDAYEHNNELLQQANLLLDERNICNSDCDYESAKSAYDKYIEKKDSGMAVASERYWEGSWYGNDTIWRTIVDLNRILLYADKKGAISEGRKRKVLHIGDMIISGEKEGPLAPTPKNVGAIIISEDPVAFDVMVCSLMGFDYRKIPSVFSDEYMKKPYNISDTDIIHASITSNDERIQGKSISDLSICESKFEPSYGWENVLGNHRKELIKDDLNEQLDDIYIWGAGEYGRDAYLFLKEYGCEKRIKGFIDSNKSMCGKTIIDGLRCCKAEEVPQNIICLVSTGSRYEKIVEEKAKAIGYKKIIIW